MMSFLRRGAMPALILMCVLSDGVSAEDPPANMADRGESKRVQATGKVKSRAAGWGTELDTVATTDVLAAMSKSTGRHFTLHRRAPARLVIAPLTVADIDATLFYTVLDNNQLAAVESGDSVRIVPSAMVRQEAVPVVADDAPAAPSAWVTRVFAVEHVAATQLVPILRPLMPSSAHLAAQSDGNTLVVVDRYANTERLRAVIAALDRPSATR